MELVRGEPLSQAIARGSLGTSRSLELATEIAEGLARAHEQGIVHRDLKPANVMLTDDGHAKIIDFGLAKSLDAGAPSSDAATVAASTDIGVIKGTAAYMSPEQARGERLDARSDLFSFGVMLYQMLSGRLPFQAPSYVDTLHKISHDDAPPLSGRARRRFARRSAGHRALARKVSGERSGGALPDRSGSRRRPASGSPAARHRDVTRRRRPCRRRSTHREPSVLGSGGRRRCARDRDDRDGLRHLPRHAAGRVAARRRTTASRRWPSCISRTTRAVRSSTGCARASPTWS